MRELTNEERVMQAAFFDMQKQNGGPWWTHFWQEVDRLMDGAVGSVLNGLEPDEYRTKLGFVAALNEIKIIERELREQNEQVKESLDAG